MKIAERSTGKHFTVFIEFCAEQEKFDAQSMYVIMK